MYVCTCRWCEWVCVCVMYICTYDCCELINEWMFNNTPARKQIGYWVSEQGRCMKWSWSLCLCNRYAMLDIYTHLVSIPGCFYLPHLSDSGTSRNAREVGVSNTGQCFGKLLSQASKYPLSDMYYTQANSPNFDHTYSSDFEQKNSPNFEQTGKSNFEQTGKSNFEQTNSPMFNRHIVQTLNRQLV